MHQPKPAHGSSNELNLEWIAIDATFANVVCVKMKIKILYNYSLCWRDSLYVGASITSHNHAREWFVQV